LSLHVGARRPDWSEQPEITLLVGIPAPLCIQEAMLSCLAIG
jgi:hypothetical protein